MLLLVFCPTDYLLGFKTCNGSRIKVGEARKSLAQELNKVL